MHGDLAVNDAPRIASAAVPARPAAATPPPAIPRGEVTDPVVRRGAYLVCAWLTALSLVYALLFVAGWQLLDNGRLGLVALLAVVGAGVDFGCARLILAGRVQSGVLLFAANVLVIIGAIGLLVPEEVITVVVASMMPVVFAVQFTSGWPARLVAAASLVVAVTVMVVRYGLEWSSGLDPEVLVWVDIGGAILALIGLLVMFVQGRRVMEAHTALLAEAQQEAERRRLSLEVARRAGELKDEFVNLVSHELRTPLSSILGYAELMLDDSDSEPVSDKQRRMLGVVRTNALRLDVLVSDLLDVAGLESGKVRLQPVPVDLTELVQDVVRSMRPLVTGKRQVLTVSPPASEVRLVADPRRLEQVFTNLISNAHKYSPAGARIEIDVATDGPEALVAVRDAGIGMSPEECAQLFTKFFRADHSDVRAARGTGLGLVISRSLVELHDGRLEVASELGVGSTFTVRLPLVGVHRRPNVGQPPDAWPGGERSAP